MKDKILNWFANGKVGASSKAMACAAAGFPQEESWNHPSDPADFNRCLMLIHAVPEIREHFDKVAKLSDIWGRLIARWDEIEKVFIAEVGFDWEKKDEAATITYYLMREIIDNK